MPASWPTTSPRWTSKGDDLPAALDGLARHAEEMFKVSCRFQAEGPLPSLEANLASQLYKIAQEAVTNAIKHAKAKTIGISLSNGSDKLVLTVHNDGLPFPNLKGPSTGMGLRIMSYRASLIGASLEVKGAPARMARASFARCPWRGKRKSIKVDRAVIGAPSVFSHESFLQLSLICPNFPAVKQKPTPAFEVLEGRCAGPQVCPAQPRPGRRSRLHQAAFHRARGHRPAA